MSNKTLKNINKIPVRTWSWLGVNDLSIDRELPEIKPYDKTIIEDTYEEGLRVIPINKDSNTLRILDTLDYEGISKEATEQVKNNYNTGVFIQVSPEKKVINPIFIDYSMDKENPVVIDDNIIIAEENSEITVVVKYDSDNSENYFHNGLTRIYGKAGSTINLIKIQTISDTAVHLDTNTAQLEERAKINYVVVELGAAHSVTNYKTDLKGYKSSENLYSIYLGDKERNIDINYLINHYGKETNSSIETRGALLDKSSKIFRGTLDFKKGASKSKGQEEEYAVLLSPNVRNRSVPILLCTEEDVEGQHAASAGKIDENKLFYLMTRGISEKEAKKLIIEAAFNPILNKIPLEDIKNEISESIRRKLIDE
ncbi:Fe-S cluster assembly protein SufD [Clostridium pasteurianum]|uniref:FeS assembly protein SufD n=1 Tax=Clostridium pasteurianum BC1 TaxID=86416 RepID=R4K855_CLOPA|nr:Fe-S cluster assembly protein SufD [Clostridium pasteurianum]AGK99362.1 FeS assembly protein SufD [Clostridium pasteurianum BC1]